MRGRDRFKSALVALVTSIALVAGLVPTQALAEAVDELAAQARDAGTEAVATDGPAPAGDAEKPAPAAPAEVGGPPDGGAAEPVPAAPTEVVLSGTFPASVPTGMKAEGGFTGGMWDVEPSGARISTATTFDAEQEVYGVVEWNDSDNESGERPEKVTVRLMANGAESSSMEVAGGAYYLWAFSFDKLPPRDPQGNEIAYSVTADEVPGYTVEVVHTGGNAYRITYTRPTPVKPTLTITVKDQKYTYNGQTQGEGDTAYEDPTQIAEKVTVEGLLEGDELTSVVLDGQGQEVGDYFIEVTGFAINNNPNARDKYDVVLVPGTLTIKPVDPVKYTVTFVNDDGTVISSESYAEGTVAADIEVPADPTKPPTTQHTFKFAGWTPDIADVTGDATYTATYEATPVPPAPVKATLSFDLAGGTLDGKTGTITIEANVGDTIKLPAAPTREGYTFKYWKGSQYAAGADYKVEGDHRFTAEWKRNATPNSGDSDKKPPLPSTGDATGPLVAGLVLAALGSLLVLSSCALRRRTRQGRLSR